MEEEGYVSIWLGNFKDDAALMAYADEDRRDKNGSAIPSQFIVDFFDGKIWSFDPDFWERGVAEPSEYLAELVYPFSYGNTFDVENIVLNKAYNAVILVYDLKYEPSERSISAPVEFIAAVQYEKDD